MVGKRGKSWLLHRPPTRPAGGPGHNPALDGYVSISLGCVHLHRDPCKAQFQRNWGVICSAANERQGKRLEVSRKQLADASAKCEAEARQLGFVVADDARLEAMLRVRFETIVKISNSDVISRFQLWVSETRQLDDVLADDARLEAMLLVAFSK